MKPVSIIFMIVAAFLVIVGLIVCSVGMIQANNQGISLYDTTIDDEGKSSSTFDFSAEEVNKIQIDVKKCDVEIICNSDTDRVVIQNISTAGYICEVQNKAVVFEDSVNVFSLTDLAQGNFRFKGFRYFLHDQKLANSERKVTVYLSEKFDIKMIEVNIDEGNLKISDHKADTDYSLSVNKGDINVSGIVTDSSFTASVKTGLMKLDDVTSPIMSLDMADGDIEAIISSSEITVKSLKGNINIKSKDNLEKFSYSISAPLGYVTLNDIVKAGKHNATDAMLTSFFNIDCENGNVVIKTHIIDIDIDIPTDTDTNEPETTAPAETGKAA